MIKRRELQECNELFELLSHPSVFPFVRQKAKTADEFWFMTNQLMEDEENGKVVSRTILDDWGQPIGSITLYDVQDGAGFLGTWIGVPYQGKGYNQKAKELFLEELFFELDFQCVFLKIRKENTKSIRAALKLGYAVDAKESHPSLYKEINQGEKQFELFKIQKDTFYLYMATRNGESTEQAM
ncbi:GNAT family N-acetyltransferase [Rummeliibacillus sp. G93]|uniref:Alanine acetyltransferase n=1 Tax=Rummeliibacillus stabekisii TaxID=241244 RepID=A0A143HC08_9BACL|nr:MULTISPECIES: GNAT family protein [Rummeliibacillus]AMW99288.1 alanine acetyltransferase [Rummeliibacillus stabekisii]MBB5169035.1 RimJ/RimL family protein N-acetyltransferase [Rummeliibacillus stabekisii]MCM3316676.1 GNAT family N-acetyltransferase [Rummeliibacillus stabekisii]UQW96203.1 GNAT family N-acetyltransferase [Rummeliibacillus sp. G93]GEL05675.1 alanine acetyltransferase [Rummeliibacillus stabekisii]